MSDYLSRFKSATTRKLDPEQIRRWEWDARNNGEKTIKAQASNAKRAATTMQKTSAQFSNLKPEHELAIKAAASALRAMAEDLTLLAGWAKEYHAFVTVERKKEETARLEAIAQGRWGEDEQALKFETDLIEELSTADGQLAFAGWCHSVGKFRDCAIDAISCRVERLMHGPTLRIKAALTVEQGMDRTEANQWRTPSGPKAIGSWSDYEAYLAFRKDIAKTSERIVAIAGRQPEN